MNELSWGPLIYCCSGLLVYRYLLPIVRAVAATHPPAPVGDCRNESTETKTRRRSNNNNNEKNEKKDKQTESQSSQRHSGVLGRSSSIIIRELGLVSKAHCGLSCRVCFLGVNGRSSMLYCPSCAWTWVYSIQQAGFGWVEQSNVLIRFGLLNKIGLVGRSWSRHLAEPEDDTRRLQAEQIFEKIMQTRRL